MAAKVAAWATDANSAFVKEQFQLGFTKGWIGEQIGVSEASIARFIRTRKITRPADLIVNRRGDTKGKVEDFWTQPVAPAWRTQDADDLFAQMWEGNVPEAVIVGFFDINKEQARFARIRLNLKPRGRSQAAEGCNGWRTEDGDVEFRMRWRRGDQERVIRTYFGVGRTTFHAHKLTLSLPPRVSKATVDKRIATRAIPLEQRVVPKKIARHPTPKKASDDPPQVHRPLGSANGGRTAHFLGTLINWGAISRIKVEHAPGACQWPLSCEAPSTGKWCDHHAGLLGRRAA